MYIIMNNNITKCNYEYVSVTIVLKTLFVFKIDITKCNHDFDKINLK